MTARTRSRRWFVGAAVAALLAPLALVVAAATPASATPGKLHDIYMYKVEAYYDIGSEYPDNYIHPHLKCNNGDIALDGMWRIDSVDQAQPPEFLGDERSVVVYASYPTGEADNSEWHFRMENFADGDAKVHLWVTCIRGTVETAHGHTHGIAISNVQVDTTWTNPVPPGLGPLPAGPTGSIVHSYTCPTGTFAVAPGFNFPDGSMQRIYGSWTTNSAAAEYGKGWQWAFHLVDPAEATFYLRCLSERVLSTVVGNPPKAHTHKIPIEWRPKSPATGDVQVVGPASGSHERRINCDDGPDGAHYQNYKAMVGGFWIYDWRYVWFLGMDPRPKQRSFKFWYSGSGENHVALGALCVRARTEKQIKP